MHDSGPDSPPPEEEEEEVRFGGSWRANTFSVTVRPPQGRAGAPPNLVEILREAHSKLTATEEGRAQYGDPRRGGSLVQAWRSAFGISGIPQICLLATGRPRVSTGDIPRVVRLDPRQLVEALGRMFSLAPNTAAPVFTFDGRIGHAITLFEKEQGRDSFLFADPWPGDSLLSRHQNVAGVDAQPAANNLWSITFEDLSKVVMAAFVFPRDWGRLTGQYQPMTYADLRRSEFWSFFHLREREVEGRGESRTIHLKPGGFVEHVDLRVSLDPKERIDGAELELRRSWIRGPNPFALDIAKSFLGALAPEPDRAAMAPVASALWELPDQQRTMPRLQDAAFRSSGAGNILLAYLGVEPQAVAVFDYCRVELRDVQRDQEPWLQFRMVHF